MIKYLLDTNIVIYTIENRPDKLRRALGVHAQQLSISAITYSQLEERLRTASRVP